MKKQTLSACFYSTYLKLKSDSDTCVDHQWVDFNVCFGADQLSQFCISDRDGGFIFKLRIADGCRCKPFIIEVVSKASGHDGRKCIGRF